MPNLKLTYFDAPGRAEPVRIALFIAGIPFEDHRVKFPEFGALKGSGALPLGSVPILEVDGLVLPQTAAMLRYVAHLGAPQLYPTDALDAFIVDSVLDTFNDTLSNALLPSFYERDTEKKLAMRQAFAAGPLPLVLGHTESLLARSGGPFLTGADLTIADLVIAGQVLQIQSGHLDGITADVLAPYPHVRALAEAYLAHPSIVAYRAR
jgi:prostaglandin-H2 D-isomerase / glutathione transferase